MYPIFVFAVLLVSSLLSCKAWQACAQQTKKATPTQHLQFHVKFMCNTCPASSASIECIFSTYGFLCSNIRNSLDADNAEKLVKTYCFYRAEEDNHYNLLKTIRIIFFFFQVLQISLLFVLFDWKNYRWLHKYAAYFTFYFIVDFSK